MALAAMISACILIIGFFVWERRSRQGAEAASLARGRYDRGSTTMLGVTFMWGFVLLLGSFVLDARGLGLVGIPQGVAWGGIAVMVLGIALRIWANQVLGRYFTRTLRTDAEQQVVSVGPYRVVRHPGYLGNILLWTGAAISTLNWIAFTGIALAALLAYSYRIHVEEAMLQMTLGESYRAYMARTWRLLPFVY